MIKQILLDENVSIKLKQSLIEIGYDVIHINDENKGIPDDEVFNKAKSENRLLISGDDDFKNSKFKFNIPIIWITPKARKEKNIEQKIDWILNNISNYNIDIQSSFISLQKDKYHIAYRIKKGIFNKEKEKIIEFSKIKAKRNNKKKELAN